ESASPPRLVGRDRPYGSSKLSRSPQVNLGDQTLPVGASRFVSSQLLVVLPAPEIYRCSCLLCFRSKGGLAPVFFFITICVKHVVSDLGCKAQADHAQDCHGDIEDYDAPDASSPVEQCRSCHGSKAGKERVAEVIGERQACLTCIGRKHLGHDGCHGYPGAVH